MVLLALAAIATSIIAVLIHYRLRSRSPSLVSENCIKETADRLFCDDTHSLQTTSLTSANCERETSDKVFLAAPVPKIQLDKKTATLHAASTRPIDGPTVAKSGLAKTDPRIGPMITKGLSEEVPSTTGAMGPPSILLLSHSSKGQARPLPGRSDQRSAGIIQPPLRSVWDDQRLSTSRTSTLTAYDQVRVPTKNGTFSSSLSSSTLAPPVSNISARTPFGTEKAPATRKKIILAPGHSPLDWAALTSDPASSSVLRGKSASQLAASDISLLRVTPSMLRAHHGRKGQDAWGVYRGRVYNMTPYLDFHPGGRGELLRGAGKEKEGERLFAEIHPWVNWEGMLSSCLIGILVDEERPLDLVKHQETNVMDEMD